MSWRSLFIVLVLSAGSLVLCGQNPASFGLKGGIALANQSYKIKSIDYELDTKAVMGPSLALFVEAFKGSHFSFQVDVGYVVKGSSTTTQSVTVNHLDNDRIVVNEGEAASSKFAYLSVVPMARYRWDLESLTPYLLLGPRVDFLLNYKTESEYELHTQNLTLLGLTCGAGLEFKLQKLGLFAELQFLPDLSPVSNEEPLLINNNMLSLTLGIRWIASE
jgi:opacity protein-like surface antigen